MGIADELERLKALRDSGALTDEEFEEAKDAVLRGDQSVAQSSPEGSSFIEDLFDPGDDSLGRAANRYVSFQMVMAVVGIVLFLIMLFGVILPSFSNFGRPGFP